MSQWKLIGPLVSVHQLVLFFSTITYCSPQRRLTDSRSKEGSSDCRYVNKYLIKGYFSTNSHSLLSYRFKIVSLFKGLCSVLSIPGADDKANHRSALQRSEHDVTGRQTDLHQSMAAAAGQRHRLLCRHIQRQQEKGTTCNITSSGFYLYTRWSQLASRGGEILLRV